MGDGDQLIDLVGQLYEAAADPGRLAGLASVLAPHFGTPSGLVHTSMEASLEKMPAVLSATENFDAWACSAYIDHYHDRNVWFQRGIRKGAPVVVICQELMPDSELLRSEWYDYCQKLDWFHCLGLGVRLDDDVVGGIGFHRPRFGKPFDEADRRKAQFILPHLQRALQIQHRITALTHERNIGLDVIENLAIGILFVTTDARLLFANRVAERVLQRGDALTVAQGRLRVQDPGKRLHLERLIGEAAQTSTGKGTKSGGTLSITTPDGRQLPLLVSPFRSVPIGYGPALPAVVVIFSDPESKTAIPEETPRISFGLTPAQARLVAALVAGQSLSEYAQAAGISINTAKTQMRQVLLKTGYDRQVDLIRAVAANPVLKLAKL